jgi:hypothetical protein
VHAAEHDHLGVRLLGGLGELQRVTDMIGEILDLSILVVVSKDHGLALMLEALDLLLEIEAGIDFGAARNGQSG